MWCSPRRVRSILIRHPGGLVYGVIAIGALLSAESAARETYRDTIEGVVIALFMYWLAHSYADFAERRFHTGEALTVGGLARTMADELSIIAGAGVPLVALVVCWALRERLVTGVDVAVYVSAAMVLIIEVAAGLGAKLSGGELAAQTLVGALLGVLIIVLNVVLH